MPPNNHAVLSASSSERWLNCPPSVRLSEQFVDVGSGAAAEGTAAHALAEHKLLRALKRRSKKPISQYDSDEMDAYTDGYAEFVLEKYAEAKQRSPDAQILIEQRVDFSRYVPEGFGTADCVIVSDDTLYIIDFKYGQGILVEAENNPQLRLYALGALEIFGSLYDIQHISMSIYQPRRDNVCTWEIPLAELMEWAKNELIPKAQLAYNGEGEFRCGDWCQFCKAATLCRARADENLKLVQYDFAVPDLLSPDEIEDVLGKIDGLVSWANAVRDYALEEALKGTVWKNFKLVEGRSIRKYSDEDAVAEAAKAAGYTDIFKKSLIGITEMERLMGKKNFAEILGDLVHKPSGKPTLVPMTDKRPAITADDAKNDFTTIEEDTNNE